MSYMVLRGHPGTGAAVSGIALAASDNRDGLDPVRGIFPRSGHALMGRSCVDVILVLNAAQGGGATARMLRDMNQRGLCLKALLLNAADQIMAQSPAFDGLPIIDRFEIDVTRAIATGDWLDVDPASGTVIITNGAAEIF
ncbi:aconitase X swivel domain-containing protein [Telmatospirillum siberiense]|uniref:Phosphomevalonate dehydratase small subunit-like domain-containing protein n=1 Tax=Telmatospirillum siberiense TaxID=382514 RepID=A0A2N3PMR1_9PROT|nr:DUF126 domain-containing protein [Telmatospirillum siberiense]PKU21680.1 hypothetical protein CWS72_25490 [Telmatospirillum siberiense]